MRKRCLLGVIVSLFVFCACPGEGAPWRSQLYPEDWTPDLEDGQGRFLPDFSYAGYRKGEAPLPDGAGVVATASDSSTVVSWCCASVSVIVSSF